jgi:hypothetical protein
LYLGTRNNINTAQKNIGEGLKDPGIGADEVRKARDKLEDAEKTLKNDAAGPIILGGLGVQQLKGRCDRVDHPTEEDCSTFFGLRSGMTAALESMIDARKNILEGRRALKKEDIFFNSDILQAARAMTHAGQNLREALALGGEILPVLDQALADCNAAKEGSPSPPPPPPPPEEPPPPPPPPPVLIP